jgi:hypothetical protein
VPQEGSTDFGSNNCSSSQGACTEKESGIHGRTSEGYTQVVIESDDGTDWEITHINRSESSDKTTQNCAKANKIVRNSTRLTKDRGEFECYNSRDHVYEEG